MSEKTSPNGPIPVTADDLPIAIDGGRAIENQCNKLTRAPVLTWAGIGLVAASIVIAFWGPRSIMAGPAEPTLGELMLLNPYVLLILGLVLICSGGYLRRSALREMQRYVHERYVFCDENGAAVINGGLKVSPIGGGELEVGYFMNDDSGDRASPQSS